jgi:hypothetical protein
LNGKMTKVFKVALKQQFKGGIIQGKKLILLILVQVCLQLEY